MFRRIISIMVFVALTTAAFSQEGKKDEKSLPLFKPKMQMQMIGKFFVEDKGQNSLIDSMNIRRMRPFVDGHINKNISYRVMPDFASASLVVNDVYVNFEILPELKFMAGKFKTPYGLSYLQALPHWLFIDNNIGANIVPKRDIGLMMHGNILDKVLLYQVGVFNGTADGKGNGSDRDVNENKEVAARLFFEPFSATTISAIQGFGIGAAATYGITHAAPGDTEVASFKTTAQNDFFKFNATTEGHGLRQRLSPQMYYYIGPFGLLAEYFITEQDLYNSTADKKIRAKNSAYDLSATFVIGGKNSFNGVKNNADFDPDNNTWGALEIAARYGVIQLDSRLFDGFAAANSQKQATSYGVVMRWHLNSVFKIALQFEKTEFKKGFEAEDKKVDENYIQTWLQVSY